MNSRLIVINEKQYGDYLDGVKKSVSKKILRDAANAEAQTAVKYIKQNISKTFRSAHGAKTNRGAMWKATKVGGSGSNATEGWAEFGVYGIVYAAIHEFGGIIRAKNFPYLHFRTRDGAWHMVKQVIMPARPYLRPAISEHVKEITEAGMKVIIKAVKAVKQKS